MSLAERLKKSAERLSYHEAAEGASYWNEKRERESARRKFREVLAEAKDAGLDVRAICSGCLVDVDLK